MTEPAVQPQPVHHTTCRICHAALLPILSLGPQYLSDFPASAGTRAYPPVPLDLTRCENPRCGLVQLAHTTPREWLYSQYWYRCIGASEKLFARVHGYGRLGRDMLVHDTAERLLRLPYRVDLPCVTKAGAVEWRPVLHREVSVQDAYVVEFYTGARVVSSGNHRWPLVNHAATLEWTREKTTAELQPGDRVALVHDMTRPPDVVDADSVYDYGAGYTVGVYIAEGCESSGGHRLTLHETKDAELLERVRTFVTGRLYEGLSVYAEPAKHTIAVHLTGPVIGGLLNKFVRGYLSKGKRLDAAVWAQPLPFIQGIVDGWLAGDGGYDAPQERWRFNICKNADLVEDMALACRLVGYRMRYRLRIANGANALTASQYCGWVRKSDARMRQHLRLGALGCTGVRRVWKQRKPKRTWDLTIGGDELYALGCGVVTHNSGVNESMIAELRDVVEGVLRHLDVRGPLIVADIGANDGTLLRLYRQALGPTHPLTRVAWEPAKNLYTACRPAAEVLYPDFFHASASEWGGQVHGISSVAMFYDLDDPHQFVGDVCNLLHKTGVWVIQQAYLGKMLERGDFTNIGHEHLEYYHLQPLEGLLASHGLEVFHVEHRAINGGSFRAFVGWKGRHPVQPSVAEMRAAEAAWPADPWPAFVQRVEGVKRNLSALLQRYADEGLSVDLYAASTKANTLLQYVGVDARLVRQAWERSPEKYGRYVCVTGIPIVPEAEGRADPPDVLLVGAWQFRDNFVAREQEYLAQGGRMVFPLPDVEVISGT